MQAHEKQILKGQLAAAGSLLTVAATTPLMGHGPNGAVVVPTNPQMSTGIDQLIKVIDQIIDKC